MPIGSSRCSEVRFAPRPVECEDLTTGGKPDAGNLHVRFDERDVETGHGLDNEAPATERVGNG
jgi:hypothetical protein